MSSAKTPVARTWNKYAGELTYLQSAGSFPVVPMLTDRLADGWTGYGKTMQAAPMQKVTSMKSAR